MVNAADAGNIVRADVLTEALNGYAGWPGVPVLRALLDRHTFVLTHSELERLFLPIAIRAGLSKPESQRIFVTDRVDFFFTHENLVVECDSLRYHRTPSRQADDARRDQDHAIAGRRSVRFTHWQVRYEPERVEHVLVSLAA